VYFYETVAQTSHKYINQEIVENILKNTETSISHIDVYGANGKLTSGYLLRDKATLRETLTHLTI
jgi:hypothetical protein